MKRYSKYILVAIMGFFIVFNSCQKDEYDLGDLKVPTNVTLSYEIVGVDAENPNGDGSGMVNFTANATNAITYKYDFGDGTDMQIAPSGEFSKQYSITGVNTYDVTVYAVGTGGVTSNLSDTVRVVSTFEDAGAEDFLTDGDSKTWYWAADQPAHTGLGPVAEDYGNTEYTWPAWWSIGPFDPDKACMYSAEFVFTKTDQGVSFEQTTGPAFIPGTYADVLGIEGDLCYGEDVAESLYGVKNVSFAPSTTQASIDGEYRGTTFTLSDGGFLCWWVGKSTYDIIEVTDNILKVRIEQDDTYAWYHIFSSEKPEEK